MMPSQALNVLNNDERDRERARGRERTGERKITRTKEMQEKMPAHRAHILHEIASCTHIRKFVQFEKPMCVLVCVSLLVFRHPAAIATANGNGYSSNSSSIIIIVGTHTVRVLSIISIHLLTHAYAHTLAHV